MHDDMLLYSLTHIQHLTEIVSVRGKRDFTQAEKHSERRILYQKNACKSNSMKHINREALPELDAIVLLEG